MRIFLMLIFYMLTFETIQGQNKDVIDENAAYIKAGNTKELSKRFASTVELTLLTEEDVYSRTQAEIILNDFLTKHQPSSIKIIHRLNSNPNYRFAVAILYTSNGTFRTSFSMKNTGGRFLITEMRIEHNKE